LHSIKKRKDWLNIGGQLIPTEEVVKFRKQVHTGKIKNWDDVHAFYQQQGEQYDEYKFEHALSCWAIVNGIALSKFSAAHFREMLTQSLETKTWLTEGIYESRAKDYTNPFRLMVFDNETEMENVWGKLSDNSFIAMQQKELKQFKKTVSNLLKQFKL